MKIQALIWDFDGLVIDTEGAIFQSWQELYQNYGCHLPLEQWIETIGTAEASFDPAVELERQLDRQLDWDRIEPGRAGREKELINQLPPLPGVEDMLYKASAHGLKIGLASCSSCAWITENLTRLGLLHYFDCLITSENVSHSKPDPQVFQAALSALDVSPEQAVVFEDSPNGILAAKRAGICAIAIPCPLTYNLNLDQADLRLASLADISFEALLESIEQQHENMIE
jgi:HAD superfamily hydrolase (TIGR01509 family)